MDNKQKFTDRIKSQFQSNVDEHIEQQTEEEVLAEHSIDDNDSNTINILQAEITKLREDALRLLANNENDRKRYAKDAELAARRSVLNFATDVVSCIDLLSLALDAFNASGAIDDPNIKSLYDGILLTKTEFMKTCEKNNIMPIVPKEGDVFDHMKHEAISRVHHELPINSIVALVKVGYMLSNHMIRPASVIVSAGLLESSN